MYQTPPISSLAPTTYFQKEISTSSIPEFLRSIPLYNQFKVDTLIPLVNNPTSTPDVLIRTELNTLINIIHGWEGDQQASPTQLLFKYGQGCFLTSESDYLPFIESSTGFSINLEAALSQDLQHKYHVENLPASFVIIHTGGETKMFKNSKHVPITIGPIGKNGYLAKYRLGKLLQGGVGGGTVYASRWTILS